MVSAKDAIAYARSLIGTPYGSGAGELDCINLIKAIIRNCKGGQKNYTDAGTASLWASYNSSGKYKHLVWRQVGLNGVEAGMLAFKGKPLGCDGQPHHVGICTGEGTVVHASSAIGFVAETALDNQWTLLGESRYINIFDAPEESENAQKEPENAQETGFDEGVDNDMHDLHGGEETPKMALFEVVAEKGQTVNLRASPSTNSSIVARIHVGCIVQAEDEDNSGWVHVVLGDTEGYMVSQFLVPFDVGDEKMDIKTTTLMNDEGKFITLLGLWDVVVD